MLREEKATNVTIFYGTDRAAVALKMPPSYGAYACLAVMLGGMAGAFCFGIVAIAARREDRRASIVAVMLSLAVAIPSGYGWLKPVRRVVYGNGRGPLELGTCTVSIPDNHVEGALEAPSIFRLEIAEDPDKHVMLRDVVRLDEEPFFDSMRRVVERSAQQSAFVFVHGYNVAFNDAARRTAQISHDLRFDGAPIMFSWPSQGGLFQYTVDETNAQWTVPHLRSFLEKIVARSNAKTIHLIAHSMGNRALTGALREMKNSGLANMGSIREVLLAAPDIDADTFAEDIIPAIAGISRRITVYASANDRALIASKAVHGYPRAGDSSSGLRVVPGTETIDVSSVDLSFLGHSYYGDNEAVLADINAILMQGKAVGERPWLDPGDRDGNVYWTIRKMMPSLGSRSTPAPR